MINQGGLLQSTVSEYNSTLNYTSKQNANHDKDRLVRILCQHHNWTVSGAEELVRLANDYGSFMLRNALALAVVLNKEDGDLNF